MTDAPVAVELFCLECRRETVHRVLYRAGELYRIECSVCGRRVDIEPAYDVEPSEPAAGGGRPGERVSREDLQRHYADAFLHRVLSKPRRMTEEMRCDLTAFLLSLPLRVLTKPHRLLEEVLRRPPEA